VETLAEGEAPTPPLNQKLWVDAVWLKCLEEALDHAVIILNLNLLLLLTLAHPLRLTSYPTRASPDSR
jgi:hypothetical protein